MQNESETVKPNELGKKIARATKWASITELVAKIIAPLVNIVLARLLAPEAFGVVATITMVISFAEIFTDAGFQKYLIQHEYKDKKELDQGTNVAFWTNFCVSLLICLGIFAFRHDLARAVGSPELGNSLSVASILIIVAAFSSIQMARYRRAFDFKTLFYARIVGALIPVFITIPLAFLLRNYWALLIGTMVGQTFTAVFLTIKSEWKPSFYYSFQQLKEMFAFSMWTLLETISIWAVVYAGIFIVGNKLNDYYLGLFRTSLITINSYFGLITAAVTPVLFVALSRTQNNNEEFKKIYYLFLRMTAILIIPLGFGIYLFSDFVTFILLGSQWMETSGFIGLLGLIFPFAILFANFASEVYRSKGQPKISLFLHLFHLLFAVPTLMISVNYSFKTLYIARTILLLQLAITSLIVLHYYYRFKLGEILKNLYPTILSASVMSGVGYACLALSRRCFDSSLLEVIQNNDTDLIVRHIVWQLGAVFVCIATYFTVLWFGFANLRNEVLDTSYGRKLAEKARRFKSVGERFVKAK